MRQAIAIEPRNADYHYNLGCVLNATNRTAEAIEALSKAILLKPQYPEAHFEIGNAYARNSQFDSAETSLRRALELQPANAAIMNNLGRVLRAMYRTEDAIAIWQRSVTLQPDLAVAHLNIGMARFEQNQLADAEQSLRRALAAEPNQPEATQQLAAVLVNLDRAHEAVPLLTEALSRAETAELKATFAQCLLAAQEFRPDQTLRGLFRRAVEEAWIRPAILVPAGTLILKAHPVIGAAIRRIASQWGAVPASQLLPTEAEIAAVAGEPLTATLLQAAPISDIDVERFLTVTRAALLQRAQASGVIDEETIGLCASLARQCFLNEYVFAETDDERSRVHALHTALGNALRGNEPIASQQLAMLAAYRPLYRVDGADLLLKRSWPTSVAALLRQQIEEPLREVALTSALEAATPIATSTAEELQEGPSPRWIKAVTTLRARPVEAVMQTFLPGIGRLQDVASSAPEILIAGCGTGETAIEAAMLYDQSRVLGVDGNAQNLAFGLRQAQSLGLDRVTFQRADLDNLGALGRSFDVIEYGGLHRALDPWKVWSSLVTLLRAGGVMRIGLLGETTRNMLAAAAEFATQGNYQSDIEGIRLLRQNVLRLPSGHAATNTALSSDFFTTGTARALFFGPRGHRVSLLEVQAFADGNGLKLLGVETTPAVRQAFARSFPGVDALTDFTAWHAHFQDHPDSLGASQLWMMKTQA